MYHHSSVNQCLRFQADMSCHMASGSIAMHWFLTRAGVESTEKTNSVQWSAVDSQMSWTRRPVYELHDHNRAQSESRVKKKAEIGGGVERFYTIMLLHLKVEPCTIKLQNNFNC